MKLPVFYSENMQVNMRYPGWLYPMEPTRVLASWQRLGMPLEILTPVPATREDLVLAHDLTYVDGVLDGALCNGYGSHGTEVTARLPWEVGSMVSAALHAHAHGGAAVSLSSGFHHAGYRFGGSAGTFNGLIVAARKAQQAGAHRVGILDLGQHVGNGTTDIIQRLMLERIAYWALGNSDVGVETSPAIWLEHLPRLILEQFGSCNLLFYLAGTDCHIEEPLGGRFTTEQMAQRDRLVFETCRDLELPVAWNLGGSYLEPIHQDLDLHAQTAQACVAAYNTCLG